MGILNSFFAANRRWSNTIAQASVLHRDHLFFKYPQVVGEWIAAQEKATILDVGAGKLCPFAEYTRGNKNVRLIGVDISDEEMLDNPDLVEKHVADVTHHLPFADGSVDAVVSRSVLEHLADLERFCAEAQRVLAPNGVFIHFLPNKFALFALINQALPGKLAKGALRFFWEDSKGICGFPAVYNRCYPTAIENILSRNGFESIEVRISFYQAFYFGFFLPLFLLILAYDRILHALGIRNTAAFLLVIARRSGDTVHRQPD
jgi:SAM-dependent methyltransferase